jgi:hypothetical protein
MSLFAAALIALVLVGGGSSMTLSQTPEARHLFSLIPTEAGGWKSAEADQAFDRDTIFEYIDGAGEVYRAFDMRLLASRRFVKAGQADVIVDLFDMGSAADAFGIFAHDLEGENWNLGQGSLYKGGLLQFWRGRHFAAIFAESENPETKSVLGELGREIAAALGPDGEKPALLDRIPAEYRVGSVRWFHNPQILNYHFPVGPGNILNLGPEAEGALATVGEKGEKRSCLIVRYENEEAAAASLEAFLRAFSPDTRTPETAAERETGLIRMKDGRFAAAGRSGVFFVAVFGEPAAADARSALERALKNKRHNTN